MYLRFSAPARKALSAANTHASRAGASDIQPHHILLGLLDDASCAAAQLLLSHSLDLAHLSRQLHGRLPPGTKRWPTIGMLPHAPASTLLIEQATSHARTLHHPRGGTEHLLLAMLHDPSTPAGQVLSECGLTADAIREQVQAGHTAPEPR